MKLKIQFVCFGGVLEERTLFSVLFILETTNGKYKLGWCQLSAQNFKKNVSITSLLITEYSKLMIAKYLIFELKSCYTEKLKLSLIFWFKFIAVQT